jgi:phosphorylase/glycogen(starch) synthase
MGETQKKQITVFEVSYEICNKYGGIYTVVTSKMARMMESIQNYIAIGPYYEKNAMLEFMEEKAAANFKKAFSNLNRKYGIKCRMGKWTIRGQRILEVTPQTILIDPAGYRKRINDIKSELWEFAGVDSLNSDWWYDEPLPFAKASGLLIEELVKTKAVEGKVVAHFHEFLTGAGLLHLKKNKSPVKTVFTAHGTMLGRAIAGTGKEDIHSMIKNGIAEKRVLPDDKAREYNVLAKHTLERASAQNGV